MTPNRSWDEHPFGSRGYICVSWEIVLTAQGGRHFVTLARTPGPWLLSARCRAELSTTFSCVPGKGASRAKPGGSPVTGGRALGSGREPV